jgi:hypothetical protein
MTYRDRYIDLVRRRLGRLPKRLDGVTQAALGKCERRLGVRLPEAVREYYRVAGRLAQLNKAHNLLYTPDELRMEDGHLWFMEENQAVVRWGLPLKRLSEDDPVVYQRANADGARWYSERMRFSVFLVRMFDWQAGFADAPG